MFYFIGDNIEEILHVGANRGADVLQDLSGYEEELAVEGDRDDGDLPLYEGAPLTVSESALSVMSFFLSHQLTGSALGDLLALIDLHCPKPNNCFKSLFKFKKYFADYQFPLLKHFYCDKCYEKLDSKDSICEQDNTHEGVSYFVEIPLMHQIRSLMSQPGFYELLNHRFERVKRNADNYEDIYDGECYKKELTDGGFLSDRNNISFQWYTDGIKIFKSSKIQMWPLFFSINELEYSERIKPDHMLLAGLWFGPSKPKPELFLEPFHDSLTELRNGIEVVVPSLPDPIIVKAKVLNGTCDMPAKSCFFNSIQFNGKCGCAVCEAEGERVLAQDRREEEEDEEQNNPQEQDRRRLGRVQVYPFKRNIVLRTPETTHQYAEQAVRTGSCVKGIKGPSALLYLHVNDYVTTTAVDAMHCLWANVIPMLLNLWFDSTHHNEAYSMSTLIKVVDSRLAKISPPAYIYRFPRAISERAHWKTAEFMFFCFLYSFSVLSDLMDPDVFDHYLILVKALFTLYQNSISENELDVASRLLTEFVSRFEVIYGVRHMSINVHSLQHLPLMVKRFGPLPIASCFPHESLGGVMKNLIHGTRYVDSQICYAASIIANLPRLKARYLTPDSDAFKFCDNMDHRSLRYRLTRVAPALYKVGNSELVEPLPPLISDALLEGQIPQENCALFYRLLKDKHLYVSESYARALKSISSYVKYTSGNLQCIGKVRCFVEVRHLEWDEPRCYAVVTRLNTIQPYSINFIEQPLSFVHECISEGITESVDCRNLNFVCFANAFQTVRHERKCLIVEPFNYAGVS